MTKVDARTLDFFDRSVVLLICEKYGMDDKKALRDFLESETYQMLIDKEQEVYMMSPAVVFDMWESEKITGEPRNSQYIRGDY
jgi:predicted DsbA family dithiol-disulfide isomerase